MCRLGTLGARLYRGEVSYDFVGHRKIWYAVSAVCCVISIVLAADAAADAGHRVPRRRRVPGDVARR